MHLKKDLKCRWQWVRNTVGNDKDNHHRYPSLCTRNVHNMLSAKTTLFCLTAIAESICQGNPI